MVERTFQRKETVPIHVEIKVWDGVYVIPSEGVKLTITNPAKVVKKLDNYKA